MERIHENYTHMICHVHVCMCAVQAHTCVAQITSVIHLFTGYSVPVRDDSSYVALT